jgi:hypothetical protein
MASLRCSQWKSAPSVKDPLGQASKLLQNVFGALKN